LPLFKPYPISYNPTGWAVSFGLLRRLNEIVSIEPNRLIFIDQRFGRIAQLAEQLTLNQILRCHIAEHIISKLLNL